MHEPSAVRTELRLQRPVLSGARVQCFPKACSPQLDLLFWKHSLPGDESKPRGTDDSETQRMSFSKCCQNTFEMSRSESPPLFGKVRATGRPAARPHGPASARDGQPEAGAGQHRGEGGLPGPRAVTGHPGAFPLPTRAHVGSSQPFIHLTNKVHYPQARRDFWHVEQTFILHRINPISSCYRH